MSEMTPKPSIDNPEQVAASAFACENKGHHMEDSYERVGRRDGFLAGVHWRDKHPKPTTAEPQQSAWGSHPLHAQEVERINNEMSKRENERPAEPSKSVSVNCPVCSGVHAIPRSAAFYICMNGGKVSLSGGRYVDFIDGQWKVRIYPQNCNHSAQDWAFDKTTNTYHCSECEKQAAEPPIAAEPTDCPECGHVGENSGHHLACSQVDLEKEAREYAENKYGRDYNNQPAVRDYLAGAQHERERMRGQLEFLREVIEDIRKERDLLKAELAKRQVGVSKAAVIAEFDFSITRLEGNVYGDTVENKNIASFLRNIRQSVLDMPESPGISLEAVLALMEKEAKTYETYSIKEGGNVGTLLWNIRNDIANLEKK